MSARRRSTTHPGPQRLLRKAPWSAFVLLGGLCVPCVVPAIALAQNPKVVAPSARNCSSPTSLKQRGASAFRLPGFAPSCARKAPATSARPRTGRDGPDADHARNLVRSAHADIGSAAILTIRATTSSPARPICARCWIATDRRAGLLPIMLAPDATKSRCGGGRCLGKRAPMSPCVASAIGSYQTCPAFSASPDWKRAPLFAVQSVGKPIAHSIVRRNVHAKTLHRQRTAHDLVSIAPRSIGLFVPASDGSAP